MKSKARSIAEELVQYFGTARQVGHTTTMLNGVDANSLVVTHDQNWADSLSKKTDATCISLDSITNGKLRGYNKPLVLDNAATFDLLNRLLTDFVLLENDMKRLKEEHAKSRMTLGMIKRIMEE